MQQCDRLSKTDFDGAEEIMDYLLDVHTHTIASGHAYNSMMEMAKAGFDKGLKLLGITEHAPMMPGTCHSLYFHNLKVVPRTMCGIEVMLGVELNILDYDGHVDLDARTLRQLDLKIASLHSVCVFSQGQGKRIHRQF